MRSPPFLYICWHADKSPPPTGNRNRLINADNGGTLTNIRVIDGKQMHRTKN